VYNCLSTDFVSAKVTLCCMHIRCQGNVFTESLPGRCLQSHRLTTGLHATVLCLGNYRFLPNPLQIINHPTVWCFVARVTGSVVMQLTNTVNAFIQTKRNINADNARCPVRREGLYIYISRAEVLVGWVDERSHCFLSAALDQSVAIHSLEIRGERRSSESNETWLWYSCWVIKIASSYYNYILALGPLHLTYYLSK
jgi:hypothetical protein